MTVRRRRPLKARAWNTAGRLAMCAGRALHDVGLALCGLAGDLDARADNAGYWDAPRVGTSGLDYDQYVRVRIEDGTPDGRVIVGKVKYVAGVDGGCILVRASSSGVAALLAALS